MAAGGQGGVTIEKEPNLPGTACTRAELMSGGYLPLHLSIEGRVQIPGYGLGTNWTTTSSVPDSAGLYLFTVQDGQQLRVVYVGRTSHLSMVTKGVHPHAKNPGRGPQRYGRPLNGGDTRKRINALATEQLALGRTLLHWVRAMRDDADLLRIEEEIAIVDWDLRRVGWNRA